MTHPLSSDFHHNIDFIISYDLSSTTFDHHLPRSIYYDFTIVKNNIHTLNLKKNYRSYVFSSFSVSLSVIHKLIKHFDHSLSPSTLLQFINQILSFKPSNRFFSLRNSIHLSNFDVFHTLKLINHELFDILVSLNNELIEIDDSIKKQEFFFQLLFNIITS